MAARCGLSEEQTLSPPLSSHIPHESARLCLNHSISPPAQYSLSQHVKLLLPTATWKGPCHAHPRDTRMGALGLVALSGPSRSPPLQAGKRQRRPLCLQCCRAGAGLPIPCPHGAQPRAHAWQRHLCSNQQSLLFLGACGGSLCYVHRGAVRLLL